MVKLFLDDEREPVDKELVTVRNMSDFVMACLDHGCPEYVSFDHDLGYNEPTGMDVVKWMIRKDLDRGGKFIPQTFCFYVHSQNPIGKKNIESELNNYLKFRIKA